MEFDGFLEVPKSHRLLAEAMIYKDGDLYLSTLFLGLHGVNVAENFYRLFFNAEKKQILVALQKEKSKEASSLQRRKTAGVAFTLARVFKTYNLRYTRGAVDVIWNKENRTFLVDIRAVLTESKNPIREVKALG